MLKVKITKCTPPKFGVGKIWYENEIGKVFKVEPHAMLDNIYIVYLDPWRGISKDDCEIVVSWWEKLWGKLRRM